jgi:hypothetical protein
MGDPCANSFLYAVDEDIPIDQFPSFFTDAELNFAENMLCGQDDKIAAISVSEGNVWNPERHTWRELRQLVSMYASASRLAGLRKGDVVVCKCIMKHFPRQTPSFKFMGIRWNNPGHISNRNE